MILKGSVHNKSNREMRKIAKVLWPVSPCSYPSSCLRFKFLNRSVHNDSNRETRENREQKRECPLQPRSGSRKSPRRRFPLPSRVGTESREERRGPRSRRSRFRILKQSVRNNTNRERRENRESYYGLLLLVRAVRGSSF